jgi:hypothetical protein
MIKKEVENTSAQYRLNYISTQPEHKLLKKKFVEESSLGRTSKPDLVRIFWFWSCFLVF